MQTGVRPRPRRITATLLAVISAVVLVAASGLTVSATGVKKFSVTWVPDTTNVLVPNTVNRLSLIAGLNSPVLRLKNESTSAMLGSANITVPSPYVLVGGTLSAPGSVVPSGNVLQLSGLNLPAGASVNVTITIRTACGEGALKTWSVSVPTFSQIGSPAKSVVRECRLRFANQPDTTVTGGLITDDHNSTGDPISVEIFDQPTGDVVIVNAAVTLVLHVNPSGGALSGGSAGAIDGVATFPSLSINKAGTYKLKASSAVAVNQPISDRFMVSDTVDTCEGAGCSFTETQPQTSYTTTPNQGAAGAKWATSLNLAGLTISCDFAPFNYPEDRQPNAVWYVYDDGATGSVKTNVIFIEKEFVQITPDNGVSKYRVCYTSPVPFTARNGQPAPADTTADGPTAYFGETWFIGLLPDCAKNNPVPPCVVKWTGTGGNRIGTFLTPPGDPGYR